MTRYNAAHSSRVYHLLPNTHVDVSRLFTKSIVDSFYKITRHFETRNNVWGTSRKIPYWRRVTNQVWKVFLIGWSKNLTYSEGCYCERVQDPSNLILWNGFREASTSTDWNLSICGLQESLYLTHSGSFSRFFFALLWQSTEFKFCNDSNLTGKLDESMCQSFPVTNSVICQHHSFFLAIFYSRREILF